MLDDKERLEKLNDCLQNEVEILASLVKFNNLVTGNLELSKLLNRRDRSSES